MKNSEYYSMSIGMGCGVLFIETTLKSRVKFELDTMPKEWRANIWLIGCDDITIRKCSLDEFQKE